MTGFGVQTLAAFSVLGVTVVVEWRSHCRVSREDSAPMMRRIELTKTGGGGCVSVCMCMNTHPSSCGGWGPPNKPPWKGKVLHRSGETKGCRLCCQHPFQAEDNHMQCWKWNGILCATVRCLRMCLDGGGSREVGEVTAIVAKKGGRSFSLVHVL